MVKGMKFAVGNDISVKGLPMTAGHKILEGYIAPFDASAVKALRDAGAQLVEGGEADFEILSDAGGELRLAAAKKGMVGLKPTYGAVSRYGLFAYASSFEVIGVVGKSAADVGKVFEVIRGYDEKDVTTTKNTPPPARPSKFLEGNINKDVKLETIDSWEAVWQILSSAEAATNLARYDGLKYGLSMQGGDLDAVCKNTRTAGFDDRTKEQIMLGNYVLSGDNYQKLFVKAAKVRTLIIEDFTKAFEKVDIIVTPAERKYMIGANIAGLPAIVRDGVHLIGRPFEEGALLK